MGFESIAKLDSPIFDIARTKQAGSTALTIAAKTFKDETKRRMTQGPATGRIYSRSRGPNFRRAHRASARGERPAPDTLKLVNSIGDERIADSVHEVSANTDYAEILQDKLDRPIMSEQDARQAEADLQRVYDAEIAKLI